MKKILLLIIGIIVGRIIGVKASTLIASDQIIYKNNQTVDVTLDNLYNELNFGKEKIALAIANKGVETIGTSTLEEMASNIDKITNQVDIKEQTLSKTFSTASNTSNSVTFTFDQLATVSAIKAIKYTNNSSGGVRMVTTAITPNGNKITVNVFNASDSSTKSLTIEITAIEIE